MTEISYKGANCIVIQTKEITIVTDPAIDGVKPSRVVQKAQVQLVTQPRFAVEPTEEQKVFNSPGEYEIGDVSISSFATKSQLESEGKNTTTVFRVESADCIVAILGHVHADSFKEDQFEALGVVEILIIPIGGNGYAIDTHDAVALTRHIDPKIVIPVHFNEDGVSYEVAQASVELFIKELSVPVKTEQTLRIKQSGQLPETLTLVRLAKTG